MLFQENSLEFSTDLIDFVGFDDVSHFQVRIILNGKSEFLTTEDFLRIIFESFERSKVGGVNHYSIPNDTDRIFALDLSGLDQTTGNCSHFRDAEDFEDLGSTHFLLFDFR